MSPEELIERNIEGEFIFSASRSSGPGGQNVNKVNTKVELRFNICLSAFFSDEEKDLICSRLRNRINSGNELIISSQSERSQLKNKEEAVRKIYTLLAGALTVKKGRKSTKPTARSNRERLEEKKRNSFIKKLRKETGDSDD